MPYRDKRPVDSLTIEELERVLAIRRREQRQARLGRLDAQGRLVAVEDVAPALPVPTSASLSLDEAVRRVAAQPHAPAFVADDLPPHHDDAPRTARAQAPSAGRRAANLALFALEAVAVLGLLYLGYELLLGLNLLQRETAEAQALADAQRRASVPTLAPTPIIRLASVVLPGGHTPPGSAEGVGFNYSEVPSHLLPLVENEVLRPVSARPQASDETPLRVSIPQLNLDQTIVQGTDWEALKLGVGQLLNGATPNADNANVVLYAHNDIYGELFKDLDRLQVGDRFQVVTRTRGYTYEVRETRVVQPSDVWVLDPRGRASVTLISCYPYRVSTQRIVVFADRVD